MASREPNAAEHARIIEDELAGGLHQYAVIMFGGSVRQWLGAQLTTCLLYTTDAADEQLCGDLGGGRMGKQTKK